MLRNVNFEGKGRAVGTLHANFIQSKRDFCHCLLVDGWFVDMMKGHIFIFSVHLTGTLNIHQAVQHSTELKYLNTNPINHLTRHVM